MMMDKELMFTQNATSYDNTQTLAGTTVYSYNQVDLGARASTSTGRGMRAVVQIITNGTSAQTSAALTVAVVGSLTGGSDFTTETVLATTAAMGYATTSDNSFVHIAIPATMPGYRYLRLKFTTANADNAYKLKAGLVMDEQTSGLTGGYPASTAVTT